MPSFGFKLPIFIFAAVSTLAQTAPGQPATPKPISAKAAPVFFAHTAFPGSNSGSSLWFPYGKITPVVPSMAELRRLTDIK